MKKHFFSDEDDMRPFIVKKMNLPPSSPDDEQEKEKQSMDDADKSYKEYPRNRIIEEHVYERPPHRKRNRFASFKPVFISILSAIAIGVFLGFIVLRISAGDTEANQDMLQSTSSPAPVVDATNEENTAAEGLPIELESLEAFVLQAGVFSEKENTDETISLFESHGYSPVIWEDDQQYYVFSHLFFTEEQAKNAVGKMEAIGLETYAKRWETKKQTINMTEEDASFLQDFAETWKNTVEMHSNNESGFLEAWEELAENMPVSDSSTQQLITYLTTEINEADVAVDVERILFDTWEIYAKLP